MKSPGKAQTAARIVSFPIFITLILFTSSGWPQQPPIERPVWDVQLAANAHASSSITIQNQCKATHTFTITEQQTPFIQLQQAATVTVHGKSNYVLPIRFDTTGMNPGPYQGNVIVKCETCSKEKTCTQDREILPVRLTVLQENATPTGGPGAPVVPGSGTPTPGNSGPPVIAGPPDKAGGALMSISVKGKDFADFDHPKEVAARDFVDNQCKAQTKCGSPISITAGNDKGRIYCAEIADCGGKDCPKAGCHLFNAWRDPKQAKKDGKANKDLSDEEVGRWTLFGQDKDGNGGVGKTKGIKPEADYVYACGCR